MVCTGDILTGGKATYAADIYSYGMLLWEIMISSARLITEKSNQQGVGSDSKLKSSHNGQRQYF
jgi:hypothetical protein